MPTKTLTRTAYVARTGHDLAHTNRTVLPEFGVVEVRLEKGGTKSKVYRPDRSETPRALDNTGAVDTFHFAPGPQYRADTWVADPARNDRVKLTYDLYNPQGRITKAKLEIFKRHSKTAIWSRELKDAELADGPQELEFEWDDAGAKKKRKEWDGAITTSKEFPDGFLTVEHSPYKLRLTVEGTGMCRAPMAWTYLHVLVDKLELEWGPPEAVPAKDEARRDCFADVRTHPLTDALIKVFLASPIFKRSADQMFDNTFYTKYKKAWEDGAQLPLFAKVFVRDSADAPVVAPKALGTAKFLWDAELVSEATTEPFCDDADDYDKDKTKPKGRNCHKDRGGQRGSKTSVFPAQAGYAPKTTLDANKFPFKVEECKKPRTWAALSEAWREGLLASKTGVLVQPSRMAGDTYKVTVHAAHELNDDKKMRINVDTDAPLAIHASLKASTNKLQVWRKVKLVRYMHKAGGSNMSLAAIAKFYEDAFVEVDVAGVNPEDYGGGWNGAFTTASAGWSDFTKQFLDPATDQAGAGPNGVYFRTRDQAKLHLIATYPADIADDAAAEAWLTNQNMATDVAYGTALQQAAIDALCSIFDSKIHADAGINVFHVPRTHNIIDAVIAGGGGITDGLAHDFGNASDKKCGFLSLADAGLYATFGLTVANYGEMTAAHEIGHHMMLPHPKSTGENTGAKANNDYKAHDDAVDDCLMSYKPATRKLCGFCRLRLRGWDKTKLKTTRASNKKT